jgi:hypothetical protein
MNHFEAGGTLLSFNPVKMRQVLRAYYEEGKREAALVAAASTEKKSSVPAN